MGSITTPPPALFPSETTDHILSLMATHGEGDYIGEPISQLAHSLQAAHFASLSSPIKSPPSTREDPELIIAALLHDIGQFIPTSELLSITKEVKSYAGDVGRVGHEEIGAAYLRRLNFPEKVCALVAAHVPAKRYLCAVDPKYWASLSDASKKSLEFQGGPMSEYEVRSFENEGWAGEKVRLRKADDYAKVVGLEVQGLKGYRRMIEEVLSGSRSECRK